MRYPPNEPPHSGPLGRSTQPRCTEIREILNVTSRAVRAVGEPTHLAEDASQTVAERITRNWNAPHITTARSRGPVAWRSYLRAAALNALRDIKRSEGRRRKREEDSTRGWSGDPLPDRPGTKRQANGDQRTDLERYVGRLEIVDLIREHLSGRQLEVALLLFIDGLTTAEVAEQLGLSPRVARSHRQKAVENLKSAILGDCDSPLASNTAADPGGNGGSALADNNSAPDDNDVSDANDGRHHPDDQ